MKKIGFLSLLGICLLFTGCFNNRQDLPENPIVFSETEIDGNWAIENDGKYYLAYSTIKPKGVIGDFNYAFGNCLGFVGDDSNDRIYELSGESSDEWLINYYVNGEMEIPTILRGISTRYEDYIPESVEEVLEEDIPEGGGERITVVTDMCREQLGEIDYIEYGDGICRFNENERCYLNELADGNCRNEKLYNEFLDTIKSSGEQPQRINDYPEKTEEENILVIEEENMNTDNVINLKIGNAVFDVTLEENSATKALIEKLHEGDIVVNAREYGGFEKVGNLGFDLPRADKQITTEPGDLVLYQGNQISLFYESNSWSYTKLGKVQNISKTDLGNGDVTLTFSLK